MNALARRSRRAPVLVGGVVLILVLIQFIPVSRSNPPAGEPPRDIPPEVLALLKRSCYDCHSHQTEWPWYSRVAPVSFMVAHHVNHGREYVNFETWNDLSPDARAHLAEECLEEVERGRMPLKSYLLAHSEARVAPEDMARLRAWVATFRTSEASPRGEWDEDGDDHDESAGHR